MLIVLQIFSEVIIDPHFCLFVCAVPCEEDVSVSFPMGLALLDNFVSPEEEASLLSAVDWSSSNDGVTGQLQLWVVFLVCFWVMSSVFNRLILV